MAGTLTVQNIQGPTSGDNANKIIVPSGHTFSAAGHVVQVVHGYSTTRVTISSTGVLTESGLEATITPTSTSSKVLIFANPNVQVNNAGYAETELRKGATLGSSTRVTVINPVSGYTNSSSSEVSFEAISYLDAPATTSATRYFVAGTLATGGALYFTTTSGGVPAYSSITLMEIAQ